MVETSSVHEAGPGKIGCETFGFSVLPVEGDGGVAAIEGAHASAIMPIAEIKIARALFHIPHPLCSIK
jgi:hypothetical protein